MSELKRRNLSGIFIFDKFPGEQKRKPTCIEDCQPQTRRDWCMKKNQEHLRNTIKMLAGTFNEITDFCLSEKAIKPEWAKEFHDMMNRAVDRCKWNWALHELADQVDVICEKIVLLADAAGVTKQIKE